MVYAIFNTLEGSLLYSNAAHPSPILLHVDGSHELLEKGGTIIGMEGMLPFEQGRIALQDGDKIFFYTDGITEFENAKSEFYGEERFFSVLKAYRDSTIEEILEIVFASLKEFGGDQEFQDDVTVLGIEYNGSYRSPQCVM
jgi:sigma-B regulation protein RsbU (phosphoserine phosphatase)